MRKIKKFQIQKKYISSKKSKKHEKKTLWDKIILFQPKHNTIREFCFKTNTQLNS
jgi:hypothetical protein